MWLRNILRSMTAASTHRKSTRRHSRATRLCSEALEYRCLLTYSAVDLGTLGGSICWPNDINSAGQVVGHSATANGNPHAFFWQNGAITDLGTLGGAYSNALAINDSGHVAGYSLGSDGTHHAFLLTPEDTDGNGAADRWFRDSNCDGKNDLMRDLGSNSVAEDVNNAGKVVGHLGTPGAEHAFLWQDGVMTDFGTFGGATSSAAAINEASLVTGLIDLGAQGSHAFLWKNGVVTDLGPSDGIADINDEGRIVGTRGLMAWMWTPNEPNGTVGTWGFSGIGTLPAPSEQHDSYSISYGINNRIQIVGASPAVSPGGGVWDDRGFLYDNSYMTELPLDIATSINDAGQIVGYAGGRGYRLDVVVPQTVISITGATVVEGDTGTTNAVFTVNLSAACDQEVSVDYHTYSSEISDADAIAGVDYVVKYGNLRFAPGETSQSISIAVIGDTLGELDESFYVDLTNASNAAISHPSAIGVIVNDDPPAIRVLDVSSYEGNTGTKGFTFTVDLSVPSDQQVSVTYATANGTAIPGTDYQPTSGTVTFAPGETMKFITVPVFGDRVLELSESFFVNLSSPTNATIGDGQGVGTIVNDDLPLHRPSITQKSSNEVLRGINVDATDSELPLPSVPPVTAAYSTVPSIAMASEHSYGAQRSTLTFQQWPTSNLDSSLVGGDRTRAVDEALIVDLFYFEAAIIDSHRLITIDAGSSHPSGLDQGAPRFYRLGTR